MKSLYVGEAVVVVEFQDTSDPEASMITPRPPGSKEGLENVL